MYVLDTNVLSQAAPTERAPRAGMIEWLRRNGGYCYLSAVTVTETSYGIAWLRHRGATARAATLETWLAAILSQHRDRIIAIDERIALRAGELLARARRKGAQPDTEDAWIAASADLAGMIVLTFNEGHFAPMEVAYHNPASSLPPDAAPTPG